MNIKLKHTIIIFLLSLSSCSVKQFVPEDERLYSEASVTLEADSIIKNKSDLKLELKNAISPEPNSKILGLRLGLYYYYKNQKENTSFISKWLYKKIGEDPVYQSDVKPLEIEEILKNRLENDGYFYSRVASSFTEKKKTASINYNVNITSPYMMNNFKIDSMPSPLYEDVIEITDKSPLKIEKRFDLSNMKLERRRLDSELKKKGYYNSNADYFIFEADTNQYDNKRFDLYLNLKKEVPKEAQVSIAVSVEE